MPTFMAARMPIAIIMPPAEAYHRRRLHIDRLWRNINRVGLNVSGPRLYISRMRLYVCRIGILVHGLHRDINHRGRTVNDRRGIGRADGDRPACPRAVMGHCERCCHHQECKANYSAKLNCFSHFFLQRIPKCIHVIFNARTAWSWWFRYRKG